MVRSIPQCIQLAKQIKAKLGPQIDLAVVNTPISPAFLAGLISVENASLFPLASRLEQHVFVRLKQVRDSWLPLSYNGIKKSQLEGLNDDALRNFATSWGYCQIMGWWVLKAPLSPYSISDLRDPDKHLKLAVKLIRVVGGTYVTTHRWDSVMRIWNTGSPYGKTYDPDYTTNAKCVRMIYQTL